MHSIVLAMPLHDAHFLAGFRILFQGEGNMTDHITTFDPIVAMIHAARKKAIQSVNSTLIAMY